MSIRSTPLPAAAPPPATRLAAVLAAGETAALPSFSNLSLGLPTGALSAGQKAYFIKQVSRDGLELRRLLSFVQDDEHVVFAAVRQNGLALEYASEGLRANVSVVMTAVSQNGLALEFASERLRAVYSIVMRAVAEGPGASGFALLHALGATASSPDVVLAAVDTSPRVFSFLSSTWKSDREFALRAVLRRGKVLQYVDESLRYDREFVLAAVAQNGDALGYASDALRSDREFVLAAVAQNGQALRYAPEVFVTNRGFVLAAVAQNGLALQYAGNELQADREVVLAAVTQNGEALSFAAPELQQSNRIVEAAVLSNLPAVSFWPFWAGRLSAFVEEFRTQFIAQPGQQRRFLDDENCKRIEKLTAAIGSFANTINRRLGQMGAVDDTLQELEDQMESLAELLNNPTWNNCHESAYERELGGEGGHDAKRRRTSLAVGAALALLQSRLANRLTRAPPRAAYGEVSSNSDDEDTTGKSVETV